MPYDTTKMKAWEIAEAAEKKLPTPDEWRERLGLARDEVIPYGRVCKLDFIKNINRVAELRQGQAGWIQLARAFNIDLSAVSGKVNTVEKDVRNRLRKTAGGPSGGGAGGASVLDRHEGAGAVESE